MLVLLTGRTERQPVQVARGESVRVPMIPGENGQPARPGARGNVIALRPSTTKLVPQLIDGRDPYAEFLDKVPEIQPGQFGAHFYPGLVPDENEIVGQPEMTAQDPSANETVPTELPFEEDNGVARQSRRNKDLPGAPGGGDAA